MSTAPHAGHHHDAEHHDAGAAHEHRGHAAQPGGRALTVGRVSNAALPHRLCHRRNRLA